MLRNVRTVDAVKNDTPKAPGSVAVFGKAPSLRFSHTCLANCGARTAAELGAFESTGGGSKGNITQSNGHYQTLQPQDRPLILPISGGTAGSHGAGDPLTYGSER